MERYNKFGGYRMNYTLEEEIILNIIDLHDGIIPQSDLEASQIEECKNMVSRGLLNRITDNKKVYYVINKIGNNNE